MRYQLRRQDDNGNVVTMAEYEVAADAEAAAAQFTARAHKQIYSVVALGELPDAVATAAGGDDGDRRS